MCSSWQNILKFCPFGWIAPTPIKFFFRNFTHAFTIILQWILWSFVRIKLTKWPTYLHFCLLKLTKLSPSRWISPTPLKIGFWYFTHAFSTILPWILWGFSRIKFKMANLFAQIDKIFENVVRLDEYRQYQWIFFSDTLHMHLLQSSHDSL